MSPGGWVAAGLAEIGVAGLLAGAMARTPAPGSSRRQTFWIEPSSTLAIVAMGLLLHGALR